MAARRSAHRNIDSRRRRGMTLLEMAVTISLLTVVITAVAALLRTTANTWDAYDSDHSRIEAAHGLARHFIRSFRQVSRVTSITTATDTNGMLVVTTSSGGSLAWFYTAEQAYYRVDGVDHLLADNVRELSFQGFKADGVTATENPDEIRAVRISVTIQLDREVDNERTVRCTGWLRTKSS